MELRVNKSVQTVTADYCKDDTQQGKGTMVDQQVYLQFPRYRKTGAVVHGRQFGLDVVNGYAGPIFKGAGFQRIYGKCPMGTMVLSEDQFYQTEEGQRRLAAREEKLDSIRAGQVERLDRKAQAAEKLQKELEERYRFRARYGLIDPPESIWEDIATGADTRHNAQMAIRINAWRRVLNHVSTEGLWDRGRYDKLKDEWQAFYNEVAVKLFGVNGKLLDIVKPEGFDDEQAALRAEQAAEEAAEEQVSALSELEELA